MSGSRSKKVLVLMSGGVDSSAAAALLLDQGHEVEGVTMKIAAGTGEDRPARPPAEIVEARRVAEHLGIRHHILDLSNHFWRSVVDPFIQSYARGRTPNPCVVCNPRIKFNPALRLAREIGAGLIASGHYARMGRGRDGRPLIRKGADRDRDQSYFLYRLSPSVLERIIFPLGEMTKGEVRALAGAKGLPTAEREDSMEICFVPRGGLGAFLDYHIPLCSRRPGTIRLSDGRDIGRHAGVHAFTVGQRRGLGVARGKPLYVLAIDAAGGTVTVGDDENLFGFSMTVGDLHWFVDPPTGEPLPAMVRLRCRHREAKARILPGAGEVTVVFDRAQRAITPGQSAVFYEDDLVLGGGIISRPA